jgi:hypothetical protein
VKGRIRIRIKIKIQEIERFKMKPWRAVELTMEAWMLEMIPEGSLDQLSQILLTLIGIRICINMKSGIWIRIYVESWFRIRIKVTAPLVFWLQYPSVVTESWSPGRVVS